jgi:hypothetical protein
MSEHKNKLLTKSLGPFHLEKWSKTTRKSVFYAFFTFWVCLDTPLWTQKGTQMPPNRRDVWQNV